MIHTHVAGRPEDLAAAATYLSDVLSAGITAVADTALDQRAALQRGWDGDAGEAFISRVTILAHAGDDVSSAMSAMAQQLQVLASILEVVQLGMGAVRAGAAAAGLTIDGEAILPPSSAPIDPTSPDAAYRQSQAEAYQAAASHRDELVNQWTDALSETADFIQTHAADLAQVTVNLLVAGYSAELLRRGAKALMGQSAMKHAEAKRLARDAADLVEALRGEHMRPYRTFYSDLDDLMKGSRQAADEAAEAATAARGMRLPTGLARGLTVLGPLAAGYGVYDDIKHGESTEQAVVSQGGGMLGGLAAGALVGGAIGTAGFPVAGTIVGGVVGAATGVVTSNQIDEHYENKAAADAEKKHEREEELLQHMLNAAEGHPLFSTPGSAQPPHQFEEWQ